MYFHFIQRIIPFIMTFTLSTSVVTFVLSGLSHEVPPNAFQASDKVREVEPGGGSGGHNYGSGTSGHSGRRESYGSTVPLRVKFQPRALYTRDAREANTQGAVRLRIALLADGTVGAITPVTELPHGLTEQAIAAARQIRFEPKMVNGQPVSVVVTREYVFTIY